MKMISAMISAIENDFERDFMADIYQRYYGAMLAKAKSLLSSEEEAEELVQEVFIKLIERTETVAAVEKKKLPAYLISAVKYSAFNYYRKKKTESKYITIVDNESENVELLSRENAIPEELFIRREAVAELAEALEKIPEKYKNILEYKYILGLSDAEIGRKFGVSEKSVRSCLSRARRKAYSVMKEEF